MSARSALACTNPITITDLLEQGMPFEDVQPVAGHTVLRTTRLYDCRDKKISADKMWYRRGMGRAFNRLPLGERHEMYAAQLRKQATPAENLFRAHLAGLGLPYRFQHGFFKPRHRIVDFYLPEQNLVVEIDGGYHDREKDLERDEELQKTEGVRILRLTNEQVISGQIPDLQLANANRERR